MKIHKGSQATQDNNKNKVTGHRATRQMPPESLNSLIGEGGSEIILVGKADESQAVLPSGQAHRPLWSQIQLWALLLKQNFCQIDSLQRKIHFDTVGDLERPCWVPY